jgi:hypothetical protein
VPVLGGWTEVDAPSAYYQGRLTKPAKAMKVLQDREGCEFSPDEQVKAGKPKKTDEMTCEVM